MILYHGSNVPNIECLRPFSSNHGKPYVYLTHSKVLATIYACNPLTRPNGFFTYWWGKNGILYYDEYFDNQLETIYSGKTGFVYECEGQYIQMEKMPWVYLSEEKVPVVNAIEISNIYEQLLQYEQEGLLKIQRWNTVSAKQREIWENVVKRSLESKDLTTPLGAEYYNFVRTHFRNIAIDGVPKR